MKGFARDVDEAEYTCADGKHIIRLIPEDGTITVFSPNAPVHTKITYEDLRNAFIAAGYRWKFSHAASVPDEPPKYGNAHKSECRQ